MHQSCVCVIFLLLHVAAYLFLDETLHTKKKKRDSNEREKETSSDSGIELSKQVQDDEVEVAVESNIAMAMDRSDSAVVMESDIDTESEAGILSFDESATSDTELLMNVERDSERVGDRRKRFHKVKQWAASWSPTVIARTYRHRASVCWTSCGVCMAACSSCTPRQVTRFMAAKLRAFLHKLLEMAKLMMDRRVFLSTSLYSLLGGIAVMLNEVTSIGLN